MVETADVIVAISLLGATGQALVTVRWYEPPPMDDHDHEPNPLFEAAIFFALFGLAFALIGAVLSIVASLAPPYSGIALLVLTPLGLVLSYVTVTGRLTLSDDRATTMMQGVVSAVVSVYPVGFLLA